MSIPQIGARQILEILRIYKSEQEVELRKLFITEIGISEMPRDRLYKLLDYLEAAMSEAVMVAFVNVLIYYIKRQELYTETQYLRKFCIEHPLKTDETDWLNSLKYHAAEFKRNCDLNKEKMQQFLCKLLCKIYRKMLEELKKLTTANKHLTNDDYSYCQKLLHSGIKASMQLSHYNSNSNHAENSTYNLLTLRLADWRIENQHWNDGVQSPLLFYKGIYVLDEMMKLKYARKTYKLYYQGFKGYNWIIDRIIESKNKLTEDGDIDFVISFLAFFDFESSHEMVLTAKMVSFAIENGLTPKDCDLGLFGDIFSSIYSDVKRSSIWRILSGNNYTNVLLAQTRLFDMHFIGHGIFGYDSQVPLLFDKSITQQEIDYINNLKISCREGLYHRFLQEYPNWELDLDPKEFRTIAECLRNGFVTDERLNSLKVGIPDFNEDRKDASRYIRWFLKLLKNDSRYRKDVVKQCIDELAALRKLARPKNKPPNDNKNE